MNSDFATLIHNKKMVTSASARWNTSHTPGLYGGRGLKLCAAGITSTPYSPAEYMKMPGNSLSSSKFCLHRFSCSWDISTMTPPRFSTGRIFHLSTQLILALLGHFICHWDQSLRPKKPV